MCIKGDRGTPGLPGPTPQEFPVEKGETGYRGADGLPGFTGPRGIKSRQTIQLDLISLVNSCYLGALTSSWTCDVEMLRRVI